MKELQVVRRAETHEEDEPPLLETEDDARKPSDTSGSNAGGGRDNQREEQEEEQEASLMDEMVATARSARDEKRKLQEKERNSKSFGQGLKRGFFNAKPRASVHKVEQQKKMPTREELLIVQPAQQESNQKPVAATEKQSPFVFPEVQSALQSMNQLDPKGASFIQIYLSHESNVNCTQPNSTQTPSIALQNPRFMRAIDEMQCDPEAAIRKYRKDEAVSVMLQDFMAFLGSHFEELGKEQEGATKQQQQSNSNQQDDHSALLVQPSQSSTPKATVIVDLDEARRDAIASMERTPEEDAQVQQILRDPELLQALSDAGLMQWLQRCKDSPQELQHLQQDPALARKLQLLVDAKLVTFA